MEEHNLLTLNVESQVSGLSVSVVRQRFEWILELDGMPVLRLCLVGGALLGRLATLHDTVAVYDSAENLVSTFGTMLIPRGSYLEILQGSALEVHIHKSKRASGTS